MLTELSAPAAHGGELLRRLERPLPEAHPFLPVAELARRYAAWIPEEFARLLDEYVAQRYGGAETRTGA